MQSEHDVMQTPLPWNFSKWKCFATKKCRRARTTSCLQFGMSLIWYVTNCIPWKTFRDPSYMPALRMAPT